MDSVEFGIYTAGFFDGEGSITIARVRSNGVSDYHCIHVVIGQRAKHRAILDRICEQYGGKVCVVSQKTRIAHSWAQHAHWQLQHKTKIERFLLDMQPYCIVKAPQIAIALEFLRTFQKAETARDSFGRIRGKTLPADEIERRELLRLKMREANELGAPRVKPSALPPLDVQVRRLDESAFIGHMASVPRGETHYRTKLSADDVRAIRLDHANGLLTRAALAARYGLTVSALDRIIYRQTWKHIDPPDLTATGQLSLPSSTDQEVI